MKRNDLIKQTSEMIDALKLYAYRANVSDGYALLGELERFSNELTGPQLTLKVAHPRFRNLSERTRAFQDQFSYLAEEAPCRLS